MWFELIVVVLIGYLLYIVLNSKGSTPSYWKQHGIQYIDTSVAASNLEMFLGKKSPMHRDEYAYNMLGQSGKFCGITKSPIPEILVKDLELIKKITIKDFDYFTDRAEFFPLPEHKETMMGNMVFAMRGSKWKSVRDSISPAFTTGKLKRMMEHFNSVAQEWTEMVNKKCSNSADGSAVIDVLSSVNQYMVEVIATAVFGMRSGTVANPDSIFNKMANRIGDIGFIDALKFNFATRFRNLVLLLGLEAPFDKTAMTFFENLVRQSLEARLSGKVKRNDFQQMLIEMQREELKRKGESVGEGDKKCTLTNDVIVANSIVFFLAGTSTTASFVSFGLYALAANPDIQEKLKAEVDQVVKQDGSLDYDHVAQLAYLEMFCCEVLRCYPGAVRTERLAVKDYHDLESGLFVQKGTSVTIPIKSIHYDPKYYPNPERFDPENFSAERKATRSPYAYLPFGIGLRNCIGNRFALIESKAMLAHVVHNFKIEPTAKTPLPIQAVSVAMQLFTPKGLELKLTPRRKK